MATLAAQQAGIAGTLITYSAASGGGDSVPAGCALLVRNDNASSWTVTVATPGNTRYGQADPDVAVVVANGTTRLIGPLQDDLRDATTGRVEVTYTGVTSLFVAAIRI